LSPDAGSNSDGNCIALSHAVAVADRQRHRDPKQHFESNSNSVSVSVVVVYTLRDCFCNDLFVDDSLHDIYIIPAVRNIFVNKRSPLRWF